MRLSRFLILLALLFVTFGLSRTPAAEAATFIVTKTADTNDGVCNADCSLREAIRAANANGTGADLITFDPSLDGSLIMLSIPGAAENNNTVGDLDIRGNLTIQGNGVDQTIIDAGSAVTGDRAFEIALSGLTVTINDLTIQNGRTPSTGFSIGCGGALAMVSGSGQLTINNSRLTNNVAFDRGGAICANGSSQTINISNTTFDNNQTDSGNGYEGGAIRFNLSGGAGALNIDNSTFTQNSARVTGGAIFAVNVAMNINNSTFSSNAAGTQGGAIYYSAGNLLRISNSTFYGNLAFGNGGHAIRKASGNIVMQNSILTGHSNGTCVGWSGSSINNRVSDGTCGIGANPVTNFDTVLQDNGGPTQTHNLLPGSNAIDAGVNACRDHTNTPLATDQRGVVRPQGGICDIGAVEWDNSFGPVQTAAGASVASPQNGGGTESLINLTVDTQDDVLDANGGSCPGMVQGSLPGPDGFISLREAVCVANNTAGPDTILFDASLDGRPILLSRIGVEDNNINGDIDIRESLTLQGNGVGATIIDGGSALTRDRVFDIPVPNQTVTLDDLAIQNGRTQATGAPGGCGGALLMYQANTILNINDSFFNNNYAYSFGGAICNNNNGQININNTTFENNRAGPNGSEGGAIWQFWAGSFVMTINNSTFVHNTARFAGGAIRARGPLNINNSTFSHNVVYDGNGGAAVLTENTTSINNSTFVQNRALNNIGNALRRLSSTWTLRNNILTGHYLNATCNSFAGTSTGNLVDDATCGIAASAVTNLDLILRDNGGPTATFALLAGSNAIDSGVSNCPDQTSTPLVTDQRGVSRPQGTACDVGSYEEGPSPTVISLQNADANGAWPQGMVLVTAVLLLSSLTLVVYGRRWLKQM